MKKLLIGIVSLLLVIFGGLKLADAMVMGGTDYYVQVTQAGTKEESEDDQGNLLTSYTYELPGFNEQGNKKDLQFRAIKDRPLIKGAFLKITWNKNKGVTSYEQVDRNDIPTAAKTKLGGK
ncbi:MAG TPA: YxeA family protein [Tetragenococcus sp.]|nr:YxeA family protein [Tetragenococcus sp.]